jgi:hypothetical protein
MEAVQSQLQQPLNQGNSQVTPDSDHNCVQHRSTVAATVAVQAELWEPFPHAPTPGKQASPRDTVHH